MRLEVITGYREYFLPHVLDREDLVTALRRAIPRAQLPLVRWVGDPTWYHGFIFDDEQQLDHRIALLLEYAQDTTGPDDTAVILLPYERWSDPSARGPTLSHPRVRAFVDAAEAALGPARVRCRRFAISENTQAVLDRLREAAGQPPAGPCSPMIPTTMVENPVFGTSLRAMHLNYARAVLELGAEVLQARGDAVADDVVASDLLIRTELSPDRVLAELEPGGAVRALLRCDIPAP